MQEDFIGKDQEQVGITEYMIEGRPVPAITKYLLSDFIVNEIDKNNQLVSLKTKPDPNYRPENKPVLNYQLSNELLQEIKKILGQQALEAITKLYDQLECGERIGAWQFTIVKQLSSKNQRRQLHDFVREKLHNIESQTLEGDKIKLKFRKNLRKMNPNARHKYIHFVLYKHGIDTINAIFRLSKATYIPEKLFSSAGLKDKRGHTTQKVSVYNTDLPSLLKFYGEAGRNKQMWIQDFKECQDDKIEVGGLTGNQFGLVLRLINAQDAEQSIRRVQSLSIKGMINYFGLQRFGQFSIKTYQLGVMCMRKEWRQLVQSIILSDCNHFETNKLKKQLYEQKKYGMAQKLLHNKYRIEKLLFRGLHKYGQNYQNVFQSLPRSIKTLYSHSLQSYLWNRVASRRIKQGGLTLQIGDMVGKVIENLAKQNKQDPPNEVGEQEVVACQEGEEAEETIETIPITAQNLQKYTVYDLVLPLYGPLTRLSQGSWLRSVFDQQLKALNLQEGDFMHSAKALNAKTAWRRMLIRPQIIDYELVRHGSAKQDLQSPFYTIGEKITPSQGDLCSVRVVVRLPKSAYATMAIREMLHISSEFSIQKQLNNLYESRYCK